jgi:perosamine synthetase
MDVKMQVRLFKPSIGQEELDAIRDVFDRAWLGLGPKVKEFEDAWCAYAGCVGSVGLNSATAALHLALAAFRFAEGGKVLVPAMTFASTATAILYNRLEPVFVDCDPETLCLDVADLERKITPQCVAVMVVHFGGYPADMTRILEIATRHGLKVIEDCAHCAGGELEGRKLGTWGDIGCFSFEEKKCMTTGDGGMAISMDRDLIEPLRALRWVGIDKDTWKRAKGYTSGDDVRHWYYEIAELGYKYNMNDLMAAIGLVQLKKLDAMNRRRSRIIDRYVAGLIDAKSLRPLLPYRPHSKDSYWIFGVRCDRRDQLIAHLKKRGIATGVHYMPVNCHPLFAEYAGSTPVAEELWTSMISLPLHADLNDAEVDYVIEGLRDFDGSVLSTNL